MIGFISSNSLYKYSCCSKTYISSYFTMVVMILRCPLKGGMCLSINYCLLSFAFSKHFFIFKSKFIILPQMISQRQRHPDKTTRFFLQKLLLHFLMILLLLPALRSNIHYHIYNIHGLFFFNST